jgi:hypothetical protein
MYKLLALFGAVILLAAGICTHASAQDATRQIAQTETAATVVLASGQFSDDPDLRCDLLEVKRVSGGALLVRWRLVNAAGNAAGGGLTDQSKPKAIRYDFAWAQLYYIDPTENKKYQYLTDSANNGILEVFKDRDLPAGQQRLNWAKFPAPPATSTKISISIPRFPPFEDVPIAK